MSDKAKTVLVRKFVTYLSKDLYEQVDYHETLAKMQTPPGYVRVRWSVEQSLPSTLNGDVGYALVVYAYIPDDEPVDE